jgi:hypothetical protein
MRVILCVLLILPGCAAQRPRCDARLSPINPPGTAVAAPGAVGVAPPAAGSASLPRVP